MRGSTWRDVRRAFLALAAAGLASAVSSSASGEDSAPPAAGAPAAPQPPSTEPWSLIQWWPEGPPHPSKRSRGPKDQVDYFTRRYEPAGFPLIGGNSDIGFELGAAGTLSYFSNGTKPYAWNMDLLASTSIKGGPGGLELAQHAYLWQIDVPGLFGGGVRLNPEVAFSRTVNQGYFGLGNASNGGPAPDGTPNPARFHEFIENILRLEATARIEIQWPYYAMFAVQYHYVVPEAYSGSLLASDELRRGPSGSPYIYGARPLSLAGGTAGFLYDSRDSEIFPKKGMYHQVGLRFQEGIPLGDDVRNGEGGINLRAFVPLGGGFVLAGRFLADFQFGHVPFYDLFTAGPFQITEVPGGSAGIRGVPVGRYLGPIKVVANAELRAMLLEFTVLKQKITVGGDVFFDTGRIWSNYTFRSPLDGSGVGLKYGVGAGMYWLWGQAAIFRIEAAYSPDAVSENPSLPIGLYVEDGTMF